jgi:hypothetical protein
MPASSPTLSVALAAYLDTVKESRSPHTAKAYRQAVRIFTRALQDHALDLEHPPPLCPKRP